MKQTQIVLGLLFPPCQDAAKAIHPTVRAFHHPSSGLETSLAFERLGLFAAGANVRGIPELLGQVSGFVVIVPFVQAQSLRSLPGGLRSFHGDTFERRLHHLEVIAVGSVHGQADGDAVGLRQQAAFDALFRPIRGIRATFFPRQAGPWSLPHPLIARPSPGLLPCHSLAVRPATIAGTRRPAPILESGHGLCCWDRSLWHPTRPTGSRSATQTKSRSCTCGRRPAGDHRQNGACSRAWATRAESWPTVRPRSGTIPSDSSTIPFWGILPLKGYTNSKVIRIGSYALAAVLLC